MADTFQNVANQDNPANRWFAITPDDDTDLAITPRGIMCTEAGNLVAIDAGGASMTVAMTAGSILPLRPTRVGETSTGTFYGLY